MKNCFLTFIFFLLNCLYAFSADVDYIVYSDNANVYDFPSFNSSIIRTLSFPEPINVYEIKGTGELKHGILDKWVRINDFQSEWINYSEIIMLPFVVRLNSRPKEDSKESFIIKSIYREDTNLFFKCEWLQNPYYFKNLYFIIPATSSIRINNGNTIIIKNNPCARLYNLCEYFNDNIQKYPNNSYTKQQTKTRISKSQILLDYGIRIGLEKGQIIKILGDPTQESKYLLIYEAFYIGYGYRISFTLKSGKVTGIIYEVEK